MVEPGIDFYRGLRKENQRFSSGRMTPPCAGVRRDEKQSKRLIQKVVKSNEKSRGGDGEDITEIQNEFPITPTAETDTSKHLKLLQIKAL